MGSHTLPWGVPGLEKYHGDTIFLTEALTREALSALDTALKTDKPFYLYMSHYAVHVPLEADARYYQRYHDMGLEEPEARYASMIEGMDKSLGDIMDWVEEKQLEDNTVIIFMSDNGGLSAHGRGGMPHTHNSPLNSGKGSAYEGGIREPMIVKWPGIIKPGSTADDCVIIEDFFPSVLEMAGIKRYYTVQETDGQSFIPILKGRNVNDRRSLVWHFPNKWIEEEGHGIATTSTIRRGRYKLIYYYKDQHFELFDLNNDIGEQHNLADIKPHKTRQMARRLGRYLRKAGAQRPVFRETGAEAPWPDRTLTSVTFRRSVLKAGTEIFMVA
jgi:arylsulfatase A-like enzyme